MSKESARASAEHRKAVVDAIRMREAARRRRNRIALIVVGAAAVVIVVVVVVNLTHASSEKPGAASQPGVATGSTQILPAPSSGQITTQAAVTQVKDTSGIPGVLAWNTTGWPGDGGSHPGALEHDHVAGPVKYSILPPVGGPHNPIWMNAGVYTKPIPSERAVHNLEHGAIWITYDPNLSAADVAALTAFVAHQSLIPESQAAVGIANDANRYMDLSPWATNSLPSPIVISAWGHQLRVTSPTDPRLQRFVDVFRHNATYSPEFGAAVDGIPVLSGGRASVDGGTQANPPGQAQ